MKKRIYQSSILYLVVFSTLLSYSQSTSHHVDVQTPLIELIDKSIDDKGTKTFFKALKKNDFKNKELKYEDAILFTNKTNGFLKVVLKSDKVYYIEFNLDISLFEDLMSSRL
jgi:hypothetical protein